MHTIKIVVFITDAQAVGNAHFGQGTGPMLLDNVACRGNEASIKNCNKGFDAGEDSHAEDAGVICVKKGRKLHKNCTDFYIAV